MLGQIQWTNERRATLEAGWLFDLPVLVLRLPVRGKSRERILRKGLERLAAQRVSRVLAPRDWEWWPLLRQRGLRPVDTCPLHCALAPVWVAETLRGKMISPQRAVVTLKGERESGEVAGVARLLCPVVRNLVIDVPGASALAARLRREAGLPVLPPGSVRADLTLCFSPGPVLEGAAPFLKNGRSLPAEYDAMSVLSVLWENQRIKTEEIGLKVNFP